MEFGLELQIGDGETGADGLVFKADQSDYVDNLLVVLSESRAIVVYNDAIYQYEGWFDYYKLKALAISGGEITAGDEVAWPNNGLEYNYVVVEDIVPLSPTTALAVCLNYLPEYFSEARIITLDNLALTLGNPAQFYDQSLGIMTWIRITALSATKAIVICTFNDNAFDGTYAKVASISGTSISFGNETFASAFSIKKKGTIYSNTKNNRIGAFVNLDASTAIALGYETDSGDYVKTLAVILSVSGTTVSFGTAAEVTVPGEPSWVDITKLSSTKALATFYYDTPDSAQNLYAVVLDVSGTTVTPGTVRHLSIDGDYRGSVTALSSTQAVFFYRRQTGSYGVGYMRLLDISGTEITCGPELQITTDAYAAYTVVKALNSTKALSVFLTGQSSIGDDKALVVSKSDIIVPLVGLVLEAFSPSMINRITLPAGNIKLQSFAPLGGVSRVYIPAASLSLQTFGVETNVNNRLKFIDRTSIVFEDRASIFWEKEALSQHATVPASELVLTGYGPATIGGIITSRVPLSSLFLSPHSPLSGVSRVRVASSSLILTPFAPTGLQIIPALIPAGSLVLQAFAPRLIERVSMPASSLILTPFAPGIVQQIYAHIPAGNLVLTAGAPRAGIIQYASIPAGGLVLQGFAPLYIWTPSQVHLVTLQNIYLCILTGAADGVDDITIPISSFQSTMRDGDPSYLACVIPNSVDYVAAIAARPNGDIVIRKGYRFSDGSMQTEEIIRVDYESLQVNRGARSDSATISGHKTTSSSNPKRVNLSGVSYYGLQANGKRTFRADPDLFLRVGDTAVYGAESIVVDQINYTVGERQATMQVTEA